MRITRKHLLGVAGGIVGTILVILVASRITKSNEAENRERIQHAAEVKVETGKMEAYVRSLGWVPATEFYQDSNPVPDTNRIWGLVKFGACSGLEVSGDYPFNPSSVTITIRRPTGKTSGSFDTATYPIAEMPYQRLRDQAEKFGAGLCFLDTSAAPK